MPRQKPVRVGQKLATKPYDKKALGRSIKNKKKKQEAKKNPLFVSRPKNYGIGQNVQPKKDLTRYVKWPRYVRLQRQKRVLYNRLKVPPSIHQFSRTLDKSLARDLFGLLDKYRPETRAEKKARLKKQAKEIANLKEGEKPSKAPKPYTVKKGINHVTSLVESRRAKLLIIAHDVDPIEIVVWLPALARRLNVPYCIVKSKSRLGQVVNQKTAAALAITEVRKEHQATLANLCESISETYNERYDDLRRQWGGLILGQKAIAAERKAEKARKKAVGDF
eukprot:CAMPEP_0174250888 /NCGR_PEP_ID=MMETSP0439-20130205/908_1 /TAXON_ID=0 /ORGANISM="Stereomyxa ramosa, Strain Chinc5" /LENGTH=277 /DNA_ID=CAMNT_0015331067 /DNA_START=33 /DNA_END=866 /DNA_ORIENTATION=-